MNKTTAKNLYEMMEFPKEGIFSKVITKGEASNYTLMCLAAGTDISEHTSTMEGSVTVLKGKGTFVLNGESIKMEPGVFIYMQENAPHSLNAEEDLAFLLSLYGKKKSIEL